MSIDLSPKFNPQYGLSANRPVGDFFAPYFRVDLSNSGNPEDVLSFLGGEKGVQPVLSGMASTQVAEDRVRTVIMSAASLTAETRAGSPFRFNLVITPEYNDALRILDGHLLGWATVARVVWGYISADGNHLLTNKHYFRNIQPQAKFGENVEITLNGLDIISDEAMRRTKSEQWGRNLTYLDVFNKLVKRVSYTIDEEKLREAVKATHPIFKPLGEDIVQTMNDWSFIVYLFRRLGLTFSITEKKLTIFDPVRPYPFKLAYTFKWRQELSENTDIPIYSMDANYLPQMFLPPAGRGLLTAYFDENEKQYKVRATTPEDLDTKKMKNEDGAGNNPGSHPIKNFPQSNTKFNDKGKTLEMDSAPPMEKNDTGTVLSSPDPLTENIDAVAEAISKDATVFSNPLIKIRAPGVVDMFPGLIVKLSGATPVFDNYYVVLGVKHSISSSGYDMDVELFRYLPPVVTTEKPGETPQKSSQGEVVETKKFDAPLVSGR